MKLRILMPIKYISTLKEIVLAKLKQCYGSKIVHLLQDNEVTKNKKKMILALTGEMQQRVKNWGQGYKEAPELLLSREDILETLRNVILFS